MKLNNDRDVITLPGWATAKVCFLLFYAKQSMLFYERVCAADPSFLPKKPETSGSLGWHRAHMHRQVRFPQPEYHVQNITFTLFN